MFENKVPGNKSGHFRQRTEYLRIAKPRRLKWARHSLDMEDKVPTQNMNGGIFL